ncbi:MULTISPECIES: hypothetical protein [unclassified Serratia (in: enterobacteria)]|uniref:hypothetical protein n=1 Tax=unclassified Serratia (in: enterobacteria) TaxID=2647522 RepID=UPI0027EC4B20|nr:MULTISPECIES: hypothetical protein [unclassified Serratia (in: enterobacteria)]MDQ7097416.1 hypothetical protein [Serratia sp. MF2]MDQ7104881.1 hypothetical protein [Serratia sp. MF1(2023)]
MSGKPNKKQQEQAGQAAPAEVKAPEAPVITPTVAGHYQAVTQPGAPSQPDTPAPELTGEGIPGTATGDASGTQLDAEQLNQAQTLTTETLATPGDANPAGVEVLLVKAASGNGFWRAGRFWPNEGVHAFVSDDPDVDNAASLAEDGAAPFISVATAERLKAEPNLHVTVVETVSTDDKGE